MKVYDLRNGFVILMMALLILVGCQSEAEEAATAVPIPATEVAIVVEDTAVPPTSTPIPEPTSPPEPVLITSADDMVGIWLGKVAGEKGYMMYTEDGRYTVALTQDDLGTAPRVSGEYWFEDGNIHLRDLENTGHWAVCDAETVGVYEVVVAEDESLLFQTVDDGCDEGGFTRNYIFANMVQEWIAEPVALAEAEAEVEADNPELAAALQAIVDQAVANGSPGAVLMIDAPDMNFTWKGAAGMADPDAGLEMVADDQFIISSGTKMFTAVTVLKLAEQGKLNLDDPISQYLPEELVARLHILDDQSLGETITVRQLLNHTSGLGDFSNGVDVDENGVSDFKELVLTETDTIWNPELVLEWAIENAPPVAAPDEMFNYSDTNFQLLGMIIENASGMSLHEAYRQLIFEPVGMEHTYFEFYEGAVAGVDGRSLSQAFYNGTNWNALDSHSYEWGSGGLVSTVEDQNRFLWAWVNGDLFDDPASKEAMMNWGETGGPGNYYGLGMYRFVIDEWDIPGLGELHGHGGLFNSQAFYWPDQNITISGTLNSNEPQFGFVFLMIEAMFTVQELAAD